MKPLVGCVVRNFKQIFSHYNSSRVSFSTVGSVPNQDWMQTFTVSAPKRGPKYDYLFVLDFEATCDNVQKPEPQEIIEQACLRLNTRTLEVDSAFHEYIRPVAHPELTPFCVQLTGIMQETIDRASTFDKVWNLFIKWLEESKGNRESFIFVTSGHWDLQYMLPHQLKYSQISPSEDLQRWIDLKKAFAKNYGRYPFGIKDMLSSLSIHPVGKLHSAMDDCANIVNILKRMINDNRLLDQTDRLKEQQ